MSHDSDSSRTAAALALLHRVEDFVLATLLGTLVILAPLQIVLRNFFDSGWIWADPFLRVLVLWIALLGALAASRQDKQISVDVVSKFLSSQMKSIVGAAIGAFTTIVCSLVAYHSWLFVIGERAFGSTAFGSVPAWLCQIVIPISFSLIALRHLGRAYGHAMQVLNPPVHSPLDDRQTAR